MPTSLKFINWFYISLIEQILSSLNVGFCLGADYYRKIYADSQTVNF